MQKITFTLTLLICLLVLSNTSKGQYAFDHLPFADGGMIEEETISVIDTFLYCAAMNVGTVGREPWLSNGLPGGDSMIKDINPGKEISFGLGNNGFTYYNGKAYFVANDKTHGYELWMTDGSANGTQLVKDIYPSPYPSAPESITVANGKLYFSANDGTNGKELWISDGTTNGTQLLKDISTGAASSEPSLFTEFGGKVYFAANRDELWVTDGTTNGTQLIKATSASSSEIEVLITYNNKLYILGDGGFWESDGTTNGTIVIKPKLHVWSNVVVFNNKMYFGGWDSTISNVELWVSDGTANGTQMLKDISPLPNKSSRPELFTIVGGQLFFVANDDLHNEELWVTDGTVNGTNMVKDIESYPFRGSSPRALTAYNNILFFSAKDSTRKSEVWISDGTANGTIKVTHPTTGLPYITRNNDVPFTVCNNSLYFLGIDYQFWKITDTSSSPPPKGIATTMGTSKISIAPNPAHDKLTISFDKAFDNAQLSIVDLSGKVILKKPVNTNKKNIEVAIPNIPTGVYLLNIHHKDGVATERLLIE